MDEPKNRCALCGSVMMSTNGSVMMSVEDHVRPILSGQYNLELSGEVSKDTIDYLTGQIRKIESVILKEIKLRDSFKKLQTVPGIGKILALTIMLETGSIKRFPSVGNFSSYCRKVPTKWTSNDKKKGKGNSKSGNKYLAWAFSEAAEFARRYDKSIGAFYNRKAARTNRMVAHSALAHKLTRAAYYIMRDNVEFECQKLFA